jgi:hypothetical protein
METTETSLTLFKSIFDNKTHKRMDFKSFQEFEDLLFELAKVKRASKKDAQLISPATYLINTTRANDNVVDWAGWCAVDVDDHDFKGDLKSELDELAGDWYYICYSTASSTSDNPKFRLVFPLRRRIRKEDIRRFWYALNTKLGSIGDRQTKDLSRMYYVPGQYSMANNFIFTGGGVQSIDPYALMQEFPYVEKREGNNFFDRLPEEVQKQIIEHRKSKLDNTNYSWNSYHDCPFFPKHLEAEYRAITGTGWYHTMYRIMVSIAANAIRKEYPITAAEISQLCKQLDNETGNWYANRPLDKEADRALEFVYRNM